MSSIPKNSSSAFPDSVYDQVYKSTGSIHSESKPFDEPAVSISSKTTSNNHNGRTLKARPGSRSPVPQNSNHSSSKSDKAKNVNDQKYINLANMLRQCANYVERGEFHPVLYEALGALHIYTGERSSSAASVSGEVHSSSSIKQAKDGKKFRDKHGHPHANLGSIGKKIWSATANIASNYAPSQPPRNTASSENNSNFREDVWCEKHFVMGCSCNTNGNDDLKNASKMNGGGTTKPLNSVSPPNSAVVSPTNKNSNGKPSFQRPVNPNSNLVANGWIEQQRRSKMRVVWKEVLASLVLGRKATEETTLWIQRQVTSSSGRKELEALHQIPIKWLEEVTYLDIYGDHRFSLKVYNVAEDYQFRCNDEESAQNWIVTLRSAKDTPDDINSLKSSESKHRQIDNVTSDNVSSTKSPTSRETHDQVVGTRAPVQHSYPSQQNRPATNGTKNFPIKLSIKELKAIANGYGVGKFFQATLIDGVELH